MCTIRLSHSYFHILINHSLNLINSQLFDIINFHLLYLSKGYQNRSNLNINNFVPARKHQNKVLVPNRRDFY
ncbi:hypothetical protein BpHYR1_012567 [Brachionus plicatilis]|uniref:Uncharacterized protein n=1 Tax=Brachionus plicatilis TaxID=10195 RepID=A0A3M7PK23_BRAPC|nr:hypothetical protein BpHYR1_012567 [Brachionus plicatilis]